MSFYCQICQSDDLELVLEIENAPDSCQRLYRRMEDASNEKSKHLKFVLCNQCFTVQNENYFEGPSESKKSHYDENYYCSFTQDSTQAQKYQEQTATRINSILSLENKKVLEIACGDGFFLKCLTSFHCHPIGFEPSSTYHLAKRHPHLELYKDYFEPEKSQNKWNHIDLFILRHVLEHLQQPVNFLKIINSNNTYRKSARYFFIEVPNLEILLEENLFFDFYYEHIFYFSMHGLLRLLSLSGWTFFNKLTEEKSEFLGIIARNSPGKTPISTIPTRLNADNIRQKTMTFKQNFLNWNKKLSNMLSELYAHGKTIAVWGTGSRGVAMMTSLQFEPFKIQYVIDSDSNKHFLYIPGILSQVSPPERLRQDPVDYLIITSYTYFDEIFSSLTWFREQGGRFIKVYPNIEII